MSSKHSQTLADLHNTKAALAASEKRSRKATRKLREIENVLKPIISKMRYWSESPLGEDANAARLATIGECRRVIGALEAEFEDSESEAVAA